MTAQQFLGPSLKKLATSIFCLLRYLLLDAMFWRSSNSLYGGTTGRCFSQQSQLSFQLDSMGSQPWGDGKNKLSEGSSLQMLPAAVPDMGWRKDAPSCVQHRRCLTDSEHQQMNVTWICRACYTKMSRWDSIFSVRGCGESERKHPLS